MIDVLIQSHNEELNLPHSLKSVAGWASRIFVVDSGSTDRSLEIAASFNATVVHKPWEGYARQKNWAIRNLPFESDWVLILDADESVSPELKEEIGKIVSRPAAEVSVDGYYINRLTIFLGRPIRHCGYFPAWNLRLFKRGRAIYEEREVHEHMIVDGPTSYLNHLLYHEDCRGLEHFIAKHNRYSTLEAMEIYRNREHWPGIKRFVTDRVARRRFMKYSLAPKLAMPWLLRFFYMYFIRGGILDRRPGLTLCLLISSYDFFIRAKYIELVRTGGVDLSGIEGLSVAEGSNGRAKAAVLPAPAAILFQPGLRNVEAIPVSEKAAAPVAVAANPAASLATPAISATAVAAERSERWVQRHLAMEPTIAIAPPKRLLAPQKNSKGQRPWSAMDNIKRTLWMAVRAILFRTSFHNWYGWRRLLLRMFGAKLGRNVRVRPTTRIEIPWNIDLADDVIVGDYAILYSLGVITVGRGTVISQYSHLCAGTHDYTSRKFPLMKLPITVGQEVWIAADAFIGPGVTIGDRAVVAARATVVRDVPADQVVAGSSAKVIKSRELHD
jgi:acetyltransferase-like isoleucine patch superfamily enzyme/glycosyltransferase involved in cell wall biosynthesis